MQITNKIKVLGFLTLTLFFTNATFSQKSIRGNGNVIKQERTITSFDELVIKGVFNIHLSQGNKESVIVEADENLQEIITVKNDGNILVLGWKKGRNLRSKTKMDIYVTLKDLKKLEVKGVGNIKTESSLSLKELKLDINGVGTTVLKLNCDKLDGNIHALGTITLTGKVGYVKLNNTGIGTLRAFDLIAQRLDLINTGIGKVEVHADQALNIKSSGIGSVKYKGNAQTKKINQSGLGKVTKVK